MAENKKTSPSSCDWVPADGRDAQGVSCDWSPAASAAAGENRSRFHAFGADFTWQGVEKEAYKAEEGGWAAIARQVLIGARGESARFDLRYFEIAPGGFSSLEKHHHEHVVIGIRGRGRVLLGGEVREMGFLDTAYIAPDDPHQLLNPYEEPFGFFCLVNHDRDRPRGLEEAELEQLKGLDIKF